MFNLRRSQFLHVFGSSPDETAFFRIYLLTEQTTNNVLMIQPSLLAFSFNHPPGICFWFSHTTHHTHTHTHIHIHTHTRSRAHTHAHTQAPCCWTCHRSRRTASSSSTPTSTLSSSTERPLPSGAARCICMYISPNIVSLFSG
jgi:hypothetical protein